MPPHLVVAVSLALVAALVPTAAHASDIAPVVLPLGPGAERLARELVRPHVQPGPIGQSPWNLWDIRVQPQGITWLVGMPDARPVVAVRLDLEAVARGASDAVAVAPLKGVAEGLEADELAAARAAAEVLAAAVRARVTEGLVVRISAPAPSQGPTGGRAPTAEPAPTAEAGPPERLASDPPPPGMPAPWATGLLAAFALSLLLTAPRLLRASWSEGQARPPPALKLALTLALTALAAGLLFALPDVVLHPNAHGWDTVRALAGHDATPFPAFDRYGPLQLQLAAVLGAAAPRGHETFLAARVAAVLCLPVLALLGAVLSRRPLAGLAGAGLLAAHPAFLYAGRGEATATCGLLLLLLVALLCAAAGRRRDPALLVTAAIGLACLASFRLMGPVMAPVAALFALLPPAPDPRPATGRLSRAGPWLAACALLALVALALAAPHLHRMVWMMGGDLAVRSHAAVVPVTLLDSALWTPTALVGAALAGALLLLPRQPLASLLLVAWAAVASLAPASASAWYQDQARYQLFSLPAAALLAAAALDIALTRLPRLGPLLLALWLAWLLPDAWLTGRVLATDQAETAQLHHWRAIRERLPPNATLVVPVRTASRARTSLPDVELSTARPDVRLVSPAELPDPLPEHSYWYEPLSCAARYAEFGEPADVATDCVEMHRRFTLTPVDIRAVDPELPDGLARALRARNTRLQPARADPGAWNPRPFTRTPVPIGLHSILHSIQRPTLHTNRPGDSPL